MKFGISLIGINEDVLRKEIGEGKLEEMFASFVSELKVSHAQYNSLGTPHLPKPVMLGTIPQEFVEQYRRRVQAGDSPVTDKARDEEISVMWSEITGLPLEQARLLDDIRSRFGRNGMTIRLVPKPHTVILNILSDEPEDEWKARSSEILWSGLNFGRKVHEIVLAVNKASEGKIWLSENQIACLASIASGMDARATADMCKLNEKSVMRHLDAAQKKLAAHSHAHAVAKAIMLGLLPA